MIYSFIISLVIYALKVYSTYDYVPYLMKKSYKSLSELTTTKVS